MEAKTKKRIVVFGISALALTGAILAWRKWGMKPKTPPTPPKPDQIKSETEKPKESTPASSDFPLQYGLHNKNVRQLQDSLIKMGATINGAPSNYLGQNTLNAMKKFGYDVPLYEGDFRSIVAGKSKEEATPPPPPPPPPAPQKAVKLYAKKAFTPIYKQDEALSMKWYAPVRLAGDGEYLGEFKETKKSYFGHLYAITKDGRAVAVGNFDYKVETV